MQTVLKDIDKGKSLGLMLALFLYIYNFTIERLVLSSTAIVGVILFFIALVDVNLRKKIGNALIENRITILVFLSIGAYGALLSHLWGANEFTFFLIFCKWLLTFAIATGLAYYIQKINTEAKFRESIGQNFEVVWELYFFAATLQAVFIILTFISPEIRDFLSGLLANRGNIDTDNLLRYRGVHDSGGFDLSVTQGFAAIYGVFSVLSAKRSGAVLRMLFVVIVLFSIILVGRTGLVIFCIGLAIMFVLWPRKSALLVLIGVLSVLVLILLIQTFFPEQYELLDTSIFKYAFELFINYSDGGGLRTDSSDDLKTMLFLPDMVHLLFGSGSFDQSFSGVPRSDSGYVKTILSSGIVGFFVVYMTYFLLASKIAARLKGLTKLRTLFFIFIALMFFIEIKAPVFYQNCLARYLLLLYTVTICGSSPRLKRQEISLI